MSIPLWNWKRPGPSSPSVSMVFQKRVRGSPKFALIGCCWWKGLIGQGYADAVAGSNANRDSTKRHVRRTVDGTPEMAKRLARRSALELVRLVRQRCEAGLEEVVDARRGERPGEQAPEARREDLRGRERGRGPGADAAAAGDELPDGLAVVAALDRLLVPLVGLALDERISQEARDFFARQRAGRLERGRREDREVERRLARGVSVQQPRRDAGDAQTADEDAHDRRVGLVRRRLAGLGDDCHRGYA